MYMVTGKYASAKIMYAHDPSRESDAGINNVQGQLKAICDYDIYKNSKIVVMPDVHPARIGPVGLTMTIDNAVMPNLIGVDIGCGVTTVKLSKIKKEFERLDTVIRERVPVGFNNRKEPLDDAWEFKSEDLLCRDSIPYISPYKALGTLGGGNHFIEIDVDDEGQYYLTIHSGSRSLGVQVTGHYIDAAHDLLLNTGIPHEMVYVYGNLYDDYLHDMEIVQQFAQLNRMLIIKQICKGMKWKYNDDDIINCPHNYIEKLGDATILRKGAISAKAGEQVIIPINMRDGIILGTGYGNPDWNFSAPHGAGRIYQRKDVANHYTVNEFKKQMRGIYSTCVGTETLDEAPFAYRDIDYVKEAIRLTVKVTKILKPVYNFKGGSK